MKMKTPAFWYAPRGWMSAALVPLAGLYALGRAVHGRPVAPPPPLPVICIGNIVAGGSGKTPAARALMALVRAHDIARDPVFLTRGYGGDEARLLERDAPTIVAADRRQGLREAAARDCGLVIMDDGFQNPHIRATVNLVVIDGAAGFGNQCLLPAGPLRERLDKGLARADGFILIGTDRHNVRRILPAAKPVFTARIEPVPAAAPDRTRRYIGFAGLGRPEKFHDTLRGCGLDVVHFVAYPDHYAYRPRDIAQLTALGRALDAVLITTEKDAMRLPASFTPEILPIRLQYDDPAALLSFVRERL